MSDVLSVAIIRGATVAPAGNFCYGSELVMDVQIIGCWLEEPHTCTLCHQSPVHSSL